jgi:hypothetical protein
MDWVTAHSGYRKWVSAKDIGLLHVCGSLGFSSTVLASHTCRLGP